LHRLQVYGYDTIDFVTMKQVLIMNSE